MFTNQSGLHQTLDRLGTFFAGLSDPCDAPSLSFLGIPFKGSDFKMFLKVYTAVSIEFEQAFLDAPDKLKCSMRLAIKTSEFFFRSKFWGDTCEIFALGFDIDSYFELFTECSGNTTFAVTEANVSVSCNGFLALVFDVFQISSGAVKSGAAPKKFLFFRFRFQFSVPLTISNAELVHNGLALGIRVEGYLNGIIEVFKWINQHSIELFVRPLCCVSLQQIYILHEYNYTLRTVQS